VVNKSRKKMKRGEEDKIRQDTQRECESWRMGKAIYASLLGKERYI